MCVSRMTSSRLAMNRGGRPLKNLFRKGRVETQKTGQQTQQKSKHGNELLKNVAQQVGFLSILFSGLYYIFTNFNLVVQGIQKTIFTIFHSFGSKIYIVIILNTSCTHSHPPNGSDDIFTKTKQLPLIKSNAESCLKSLEIFSRFGAKFPCYATPMTIIGCWVKLLFIPKQSKDQTLLLRNNISVGQVEATWLTPFLLLNLMPFSITCRDIHSRLMSIVKVKITEAS